MAGNYQSLHGQLHKLPCKGCHRFIADLVPVTELGSSVLRADNARPGEAADATDECYLGRVGGCLAKWLLLLQLDGWRLLPRTLHCCATQGDAWAGSQAIQMHSAALTPERQHLAAWCHGTACQDASTSGHLWNSRTSVQQLLWYRADPQQGPAPGASALCSSHTCIMQAAG